MGILNGSGGDSGDRTAAARHRILAGACLAGAAAIAAPLLIWDPLVLAVRVVLALTSDQVLPVTAVAVLLGAALVLLRRRSTSLDHREMTGEDHGNP